MGGCNLSPQISGITQFNLTTSTVLTEFLDRFLILNSLFGIYILFEYLRIYPCKLLLVTVLVHMTVVVYQRSILLLEPLYAIEHKLEKAVRLAFFNVQVSDVKERGSTTDIYICESLEKVSRAEQNHAVVVGRWWTRKKYMLLYKCKGKLV